MGYTYIKHLVGIRDIEFKHNDKIKTQVAPSSSVVQKNEKDAYVEWTGVNEIERNERQLNNLITGSVSSTGSEVATYFVYPKLQISPIGMSAFLKSFFILNPSSIKYPSSKNLVKIQIPLGLDVYQRMSPKIGGENESITITGILHETWVRRIFRIKDSPEIETEISKGKPIDSFLLHYYETIYDYIHHIRMIYNENRAVELIYPFLSTRPAEKRFTGKLFYGYITKFDIEESGGKPDQIPYTIEITRDRRLERSISATRIKTEESG